MTSSRRRPVQARSVAALALWAGVPALALLSIAACAEADATEVDAGDSSVVARPPPTDEASVLDGGAEAEAEASLPPCAVGNLCSVPLPLSIGHVVAMAGRSKNDVWASASRGELLRWDGQTWTKADSGGLDTFSNLFITPDELWGVSGNLVMRRGLEASSVRSFRLRERFIGMTGIAVLPSGEPYVSFGATWNTTDPHDYLAKIQDFDTKTIQVVAAPVDPSTDRPLAMAARALWLVPDEALWLVGDRGRVVRYSVSPVGDGVVIPLDSQVDLFAAWGEGTHLWAGGSNGTILHFDGAAWHRETTGASATINAIFGFSSTDIWAAGDDGTILHFDGTTWSTVPVAGYAGHLRTIWGSAPDDVWIGGELAMFHWGALP